MLATAARTWPTPRTVTGGAESAARKKELGRDESGGGDLQAAVLNWATPTTPNGGRIRKSQPEGSKRSDDLETQVDRWATPIAASGTAGFTRDPAKRAAIEGRGHEGNELARQAEDFLPDPATSKAGPAGSKPAVLSPSFVESLMGLPIGWTEVR